MPQDKDRWTPLFGAVGQNRLAAAARLLEVGAEVDALDKDSSTALMLAARKGHVALVRLLLDAGADCTRRHRVRGQPALIRVAHSVYCSLRLRKRVLAGVPHGRKYGWDGTRDGSQPHHSIAPTPIA